MSNDAQFTVEKRYSEFEKLHKEWTRGHSGSSTLSSFMFPKKKLLSSMTDQTIAERQRGLERLMELLAQEQPTSDEFAAFVGLAEWEAKAHAAGVDHIDDMAETMQYVIELDLKKQKLGVELEVEPSTKHIQVARSKHPKIKKGHKLISINSESMQGLPIDKVMQFIKEAGQTPPVRLRFESVGNSSASTQEVIRSAAASSAFAGGSALRGKGRIGGKGRKKKGGLKKKKAAKAKAAAAAEEEDAAEAPAAGGGGGGDFAPPDDAPPEFAPPDDAPPEFAPPPDAPSEQGEAP
jgi:hypothetical protein|tara:strand:+ start:375 stop:1253 length:879 start_codon:yes stop_codon:yes gene_type:complete